MHVLKGSLFLTQRSTTDDWEKILLIEKKLVRDWEKPVWGRNEKKILRKLWIPVILNLCLLLTQHAKSNYSLKTIKKTLQTSCRGRFSSFKTLHFYKLPSVLFWNWKQCAAIMKRISIKCDSNALSVTDFYFFFLFNKQVQDLNIIQKTVSRLCYSCYTHLSWVIFSIAVWWIHWWFL